MREFNPLITKIFFKYAAGVLYAVAGMDGSWHDRVDVILAVGESAQ
jgi:hypothetical protein